MTTIAAVAASRQVPLSAQAYVPMGVCLNHDSDLATQAAARYMPVGKDLPRLDFNDPQIFATYYDLLFRPLVRYARFLARMDDAEAEDIVQGTFVEMLAYPIPSLMWPQFRAWMCQCVRYRVQFHWVARRLNASLEVLQEREPDGGTWEPSVASAEEQGILRETVREVGHALTQLPPEAQAMIHMSVAGFTPQQMAQHLAEQGVQGPPINVPATYLSRARRQVREQVQRDRRQQRTVRWHMRRGRARGQLGGWCADRPACRRCGTTERQHRLRGYCSRCYTWVLRHPQGEVITERRWGPGVDACIDCGTTERRHFSKGRCKPCERVQYKSWEGRSPCVTCGRTDAAYESKGECKRCAERQRKRRQGYARVNAALRAAGLQASTAS